MRHVKRAVRADLHRFNAYIEMQERETGAWRGVIEERRARRGSRPGLREEREYGQVESAASDEAPRATRFRRERRGPRSRPRRKRPTRKRTRIRRTSDSDCGASSARSARRLRVAAVARIAAVAGARAPAAARSARPAAASEVSARERAGARSDADSTKLRRGGGRSRGASRQLRAGDAADPKTDAPARRSGDEPDVLPDVPKLTVEEISLEVDNLHAQIALEARLADLVQLRVGADVESSGSRSRSRVSRRRRSSRPGSTTCFRSSSGRSTRSTTIPSSSPSLPAALNAPQVASVRAWRRSGEEGGQLVEGTVEEAGQLAEGTGAFGASSRTPIRPRSRLSGVSGDLRTTWSPAPRPPRAVRPPL
jgi:hypothetical protein